MPIYQVTSPVYQGNGQYTPATPYNPGFVTVASEDDAPPGGVLVQVEPVISDVAVTATETGATITWTTDVASSSVVAHRVAGTASMTLVDAEETVTSHSVTLTGLTGQTPYEFQCISAAADGGSARTASAYFATASAA